MTTREDINRFIETLTLKGGHRERVKAFCTRYPNWNPITELFEEKPIT
jgi:hypothetical protein